MKNLIHNIFGRVLVFSMTFMVLFTTACTSYRFVNKEEISLKETLKKGDTVKVNTNTGKAYELTIMDISDEALIGHSGPIASRIETIPLNEIWRLEKRETNPGKTSLVLLSGVAMFMLILAISEYEPCCDLSGLEGLDFSQGN